MAGIGGRSRQRRIPGPLRGSGKAGGATASPTHPLSRWHLLNLDEIERRLEIAASNLDKPVVLEAMARTAPPRARHSQRCGHTTKNTTRHRSRECRKIRSANTRYRENTQSHLQSRRSATRPPPTSRADVLAFRRWRTAKMEAGSQGPQRESICHLAMASRRDPEGVDGRKVGRFLTDRRVVLAPAPGAHLSGDERDDACHGPLAQPLSVLARAADGRGWHQGDV